MFTASGEIPPLDQPGDYHEPSVHEQNMDEAAKRVTVDQAQHPSTDEQEHDRPRHGKSLLLCSYQLSIKRLMLKKARTGHNSVFAAFTRAEVCIGRFCFNTS